MKDWNGKRVLVLGAARQGLALARWLSLHGAHVTLSDMRSADELRIARELLAEFSIDWVLGGHPLELLDSTDVLCLSGGVPLTLPIVVEAVKRKFLSRTIHKSSWKWCPVKRLVLPARQEKPPQRRSSDAWQRMPMEREPTLAETSAIR